MSILPISSLTEEDISQYFFDCGEAKEYETFLKKKALALEIVTSQSLEFPAYDITFYFIGIIVVRTLTILL